MHKCIFIKEARFVSEIKIINIMYKINTRENLKTFSKLHVWAVFVFINLLFLEAPPR